MSPIQNIAIVSLLALSLSSCAWFGAGKARKRLEEGSSHRVVIPEGMDQPEFNDVMPIPEVDDTRGLAGSDFKVGLPDTLSTKFGVEKIVIKKLGDARWVFVDLPPATVWPTVVRYFSENKLKLELADAADGILTTEWLPARNGDAEAIFTSLRSGNVFANSTDVSSYKFRLRVEPGIRSGSTELYLEERQISANAPFRLDQVQWTGKSDNLELETKVLSDLAYYLGDSISLGTISMMATGLQESKTELIPDREKPILKYELDFSRAWATVGGALKNAQIKVEDIDRDSAYYYVVFSPEHTIEPGFFKRLFTGAKKSEVDPANRYTLHLTLDGKYVVVSVLQGEKLADPLVAEKLLRMVKEYST